MVKLGIVVSDVPDLMIHTAATGSTVTVHYSLVIRARVAAGGRIRTDNKLNGTGVFDKYGEKIIGPRARRQHVRHIPSMLHNGVGHDITPFSPI